MQQIQDLSDSTQQHTLHSMEENASVFINDSATPCDFITNQNSDMDITNDTNIPTIPKQLAFIHKANTNIETLLANQIYNTMILTIKMHSHSQINIQHYYNKNYKTHTDVYTTQSQLKVTKFQKTWTLRLCHTQCISPAIQTQSQRSITYRTKQ